MLRMILSRASVRMSTSGFSPATELSKSRFALTTNRKATVRWSIDNPESTASTISSIHGVARLSSAVDLLSDTAIDCFERYSWMHCNAFALALADTLTLRSSSFHGPRISSSNRCRHWLMLSLHCCRSDHHRSFCSFDSLFPPTVPPGEFCLSISLFSSRMRSHSSSS